MVKFSGTVFSKTFICLTVRPKIGEFLDDFGAENVKKCVSQNKYITDLIPAEVKAEWKSKIPAEYVELIDGFTNQDVYGWVPAEYRKIIQSCPNWQEWVRGQLNAVREFIKS